MVSVPRNDKIFNAIAARSGLTRCGTQWCRQALDPFHDSFLKDPCGYPDTNGDASIVQVVKQSYNIAAPITSGNWDCNVVMMPWVNPIVMTASTNNGANGATPLNYLTQANPSTSGDITVGGIQVISAASGTACDITEPSVAATYSNTSNTIPATYLAGNGRVVAMAMEIVNTTSELNKQGLVTMYRIPVPQNDDCPTMYLNNNAASGDTVTYNGAASVVYVPAPPKSIAGAQLFAGTRAWDAARGSYNVAVFNTPDVPASGLNFTQPAIYTTTQKDAQVLFAHMSRTSFNPTATNGGALVPPVSWTEMNMSGSYFTGLSNSTTLTVNYILYIERFPTQDDLDLIVSARESPAYDIKALELYSEVAQSLPVAVTFNENGWGDLWDTITSAASSALNVARKVVAPVASLFGVRGQAIAAGIEGVGAVADAFDAPTSDYVPTAPRAPPMVTAGRMRQPRGRKNQGTKTLRVSKKELNRDFRAGKATKLYKNRPIKITRDKGLRAEINDVRNKLKQKRKARKGY